MFNLIQFWCAFIINIPSSIWYCDFHADELNILVHGMNSHWKQTATHMLFDQKDPVPLLLSLNEIPDQP